MGERKVLNKYYPPDFDPAALPRQKRTKTNDMKVRMMLPMSVRCKTCGNFMYKGTKFNTRKEDVLGETYLGIQVFRFYWRCTNCAAEFTMKTDPQNADYVLEEGATRNYEPWREKEAATAKAQAEREEEERGNAMKALENRTLESKREMDIMAALDEMRSLNARHAKVSHEDALMALKAEGEREKQDSTAARRAQEAAEEEEGLAEFYAMRRAAALGAPSGSGTAPSGAAGAEPGVPLMQQRGGGAALKRRVVNALPSSSSEDEDGNDRGAGGGNPSLMVGVDERGAAAAPIQRGSQGASSSAAEAAAVGATAAAAQDEKAGPLSTPAVPVRSAAASKPLLPLVKVVAKPKGGTGAGAAPAPQAAAAGAKAQAGALKRVAAPAGESADGGDAGGLLGLGYGSSGSADSQ